MGSFAQAYREVVNRPLDYIMIMARFLVIAALSLAAPLGVVGLFSLLASYASISSTVISLAGIAIYAVILLILASGSCGALLKAIESRKGGKGMGLAEMASYALGNCLRLAIIMAVELAITGFFAAIIFVTLYLFNIDLSRRLYIGIGMVVLGTPALLIKYLFSLSFISYVKSGGIIRSIGRSIRITVLRAMEYIPVCVVAAIIFGTLAVPLVNIFTFFVLCPMALLALVKEHDKLLP